MSLSDSGGSHTTKDMMYSRSAFTFKKLRVVFSLHRLHLSMTSNELGPYRVSLSGSKKKRIDCTIFIFKYHDLRQTIEIEMCSYDWQPRGGITLEDGHFCFAPNRRARHMN